MFYDRVAIFNADDIIEPPYRSTGTEEVPEFSGAVQRGGVPDDVIMDMGFVNVCADDKGVFAFGESHRQFLAQAVGLLWGDLAGRERLPYLIGQHIIRSPPPAGLGSVSLFGKKKFGISDPAITLVAADKPTTVRFFRVLHIVQDVADGCPYTPALAGMQGHDTGGCYFENPPCNCGGCN